MKYIVLATVVGFIFVFGKVFGVFETSSTVDSVIALVLIVGWFTFITKIVQKTPTGKAAIGEFSLQEYPYMLMV